MDSIERLNRYSTEAWKQSARGTVTIIISNAILLVLLFFGASFADLLFIIYLQVLVSGVFVAVAILRQKRFRTEQRVSRRAASDRGLSKYIDRALGYADSATYTTLTKRYAFAVFCAVFTLGALILGLTLYALVGFDEVTPGFLVVMTLFALVYEYRERLWKEDRVRTLSTMGFGVLFTAAPIVLLPFVSMVSTGIGMLAGFVVIKTLFEVLGHRDRYYRALVDEWLYEEAQ